MSGNALTGVMEIAVHGNKCYFVAQLHPRADTSPFAREVQNNASAILFGLTLGNTTPTVLKKYDYSQTAARSFVVHDNMVHFFEGSHYMYKFRPLLPRIFPLSGEDGLLEPQWRDDVGFVRRINGNTIESLGLAWRSALTNPNDSDDSYYGIHGGTASPMISTDDGLYLIAGYGNYDDIGQTDVDAAPINRRLNDAIISYTDRIEFRLQHIDTNKKTGYDVLSELARTTNSIFGVNQQRFYWKSRAYTKSKLGRILAETDTAITFKEQNREVPPIGYVKIGDEVMGYGERRTSSLVDVTRGLAGTSAEAHAVDDEMIYIRHLIICDGAKSPTSEVNVSYDYTNLYNSIFIEYGNNSIYHTSDAESIREHGQRDFRVQTPIHFTQLEWAKYLGNNYLETFKDLESIASIRIELALFLSISDVVYVKTKEIEFIGRIYELEHDFGSRITYVTMRTIQGVKDDSIPLAPIIGSNIWGQSIWGHFRW